MSRKYYCTLTLSEKEVELLEAVEVRTEWEIHSKQEVSKPERVRRALAKILIEKGGGRSR